MISVDLWPAYDLIHGIVTAKFRRCISITELIGGIFDSSRIKVEGDGGGWGVDWDGICWRSCSMDHDGLLIDLLWTEMKWKYSCNDRSHTVIIKIVSSLFRTQFNHFEMKQQTDRPTDRPAGHHSVINNIITERSSTPPTPLPTHTTILLHMAA